jgi:PST family polysaccharide transporter
MADGESLSSVTSRAVKWRFAGSIIDVLLQFTAGAILARLLEPADFGLVSLAFVVVAFAGGFRDLGIPAALVQREGVTDRHVRVAFTAVLALRLALAAALFLAAPLGAGLMAEPRVLPVLRWLSLNFAIQGASVVAAALLRRSLDFKRQFVINTTSYVVGYAAVAIVLALLRYGVWSLVWGALAQAVVSAVGNRLAVQHAMRPLIGRAELSELLQFGVGNASSAWMNYVARNGDNLIVGRVLGVESLGLYTRAYALMNLPFTYGVGVLTSVLFPAMSRLQLDRARLQRAYILMTALTAAISAPVMVTMAVAAPHLIATLYGAGWTGSIAPLQILCAFGYFRTLYHVGGIVAQSAGRVYGELRNQVAYAVLVLVGAVAGSSFGLNGVAVGVGIAIVGMFVLTTRLALDATDASWQTFFGRQVAAAVAGLVSLPLCLSARTTLESYQVVSPVITAAVLGCGGLATAGAVLWVASSRDFEESRAQLPALAARLALMLQTVRESRRSTTRTASR